jgi:predicted histone-like DNA-binding protein
MPVKYRVQRFGPDKKKWWFRVIHNRTVTAPDMAERIKDASSLTEVDVLGTIDALSSRVRAALMEGYRVRIEGLGTFSLSAQGLVDSDQVRLRPEQLDVVFRPDPALRRHVRAHAELRREVAVLPAPTILGFTDAASERRDAYTAGNIGLLEGRQLKFDPDDPAQGVFFVDADGHEVRAMIYARVVDTEVHFFIPETLAGPQELLVRAQPRFTSEIRQGRLQGVLAPV